MRGGPDALGRTRELGTRAAGRVKDTASSARGQVESAAAGTEATASGALDATGETASDVSDAASASANAAGELGSSADIATEDVARDAKAPEDKPHKARGRAKDAPAKPDRAPVEKPQPKAHADGKANGNSGLSASSQGPVSGNGDAGVGVNASVEK